MEDFHGRLYALKMLFWPYVQLLRPVPFYIFREYGTEKGQTVYLDARTVP